MNRNNFKAILNPQVIFWFLIAVFVFISAWQKQRWDGDIFWALEAGKWILENGEVPKTDPFSYTFEGERWIDFTWGFQVIVYVFYKYFGGWFGVFLIHFILVLSFLVIFSKVCVVESRGLKNFATMLMALFIIIFDTRFFIRPHVFEFIFVAIFLLQLILYSHTRDSGKLLPLLLLQVLWINVHSSFILGYFLVGCWWLGSVIVDMRGSSFSFNNLMESFNGHKKLLIVGLLLPVVSFVNPYGLDLILFPFEHQSGYNQEALRYIAEWRSTNFLRSVFVFDFFSFTSVFTGLLYLLFMFVLIFRTNQMKAQYMLIFIGAFYLVYSHSRFVPLFCLMIAPPLVSFLCKTKIAAKFESARNFHYSGAVILLVFISYNLSSQNPKHFGVGVANEFAPVGTVAYLNENKISGKIFNKYIDGGYIIRNYEYGKVLIDGRTPTVYSGNFFWKYRRSNDNTLWNKLVDEEGINIAIVPSGWKLCSNLADDDTWKSVFFDDVSVLFLKSNSGFDDLIASAPLKSFVPCKSMIDEEFSTDKDIEEKSDVLNTYYEELTNLVELYEHYGYGDSVVEPYRLKAVFGGFLGVDYSEQALIDIDKALSNYAGESTKLRLLLDKAKILKSSEMIDESSLIYEELLLEFNNSKTTLFNAATFYFDNGYYERSRALIERYIDKVGDKAGFNSYRILGQSCFELSDYECSHWALTRSVFLADDDEMLADQNYMLAFTLFELGFSLEGEEVLKSALRSKPDFILSVKQLGREMIENNRQDYGRTLNRIAESAISSKQ